MSRAATLVVILAASALVAAGSASAQPDEPYIETIVRWQPGDETETTLQLDDAGRGARSTDVGFRVVGDVLCSERAEYSLEIILDNDDLPSWAGASLGPEDARRVQFALPQGSHSDTSYQYKAGPDLGIVWDLEGAPDGATYTYHVRVDHARLVPETSDCTPALSTRPQVHHAANLTAVAPESAGGGGDDGTGDATPTETSPAPWPAAPILLAAMLVRTARRP